jgi:hypothetical protein
LQSLPAASLGDFAALAISSTRKEHPMSEMEMTNDVETDEFTDELSDEALDREEGEGKFTFGPFSYYASAGVCRRYPRASGN